MTTLSLSRFQPNMRRSRETLCFRTDIAIEPFVIGSARSEGCGGAIQFTWLAGGEERAYQAALASQAVIDFAAESGRTPKDLHRSAVLELAVFALAAEAEAIYAAERSAKRQVTFRCKDGRTLAVAVNGDDALDVRGAIEFVLSQHDGVEFLNHREAAAAVRKSMEVSQ